jgi:hypothetical protein
MSSFKNWARENWALAYFLGVQAIVLIGSLIWVVSITISSLTEKPSEEKAIHAEQKAVPEVDQKLIAKTKK